MIGDNELWSNYPPGPAVPLVLTLTCAEAQAKAQGHQQQIAQLRTIEKELNEQHLAAEQEILRLKKQLSGGNIKQRDATERTHALQQYCQIIQDKRVAITEAMGVYRDAENRLKRYCLALQDLRAFTEFEEPAPINSLDPFRAPPALDAFSPDKKGNGATQSRSSVRSAQNRYSAMGTPPTHQQQQLIDAAKAFDFEPIEYLMVLMFHARKEFSGQYGTSIFTMLTIAKEVGILKSLAGIAWPDYLAYQERGNVKREIEQRLRTSKDRLGQFLRLLRDDGVTLLIFNEACTTPIKTAILSDTEREQLKQAFEQNKEQNKKRSILD